MVMVEFYGIGSWNRPVFKGEDGHFYGSCDTLFDYGKDKVAVLAEITESDLVYFGNKFGCEPDGSACPYVKIKRS